MHSDEQLPSVSPEALSTERLHSALDLIKSVNELKQHYSELAYPFSDEEKQRYEDANNLLAQNIERAKELRLGEFIFTAGLALFSIKGRLEVNQQSIQQASQDTANVEASPQRGLALPPIGQPAIPSARTSAPRPSYSPSFGERARSRWRQFRYKHEERKLYGQPNRVAIALTVSALAIGAVGTAVFHNESAPDPYDSSAHKFESPVTTVQHKQPQHRSPNAASPLETTNIDKNQSSLQKYIELCRLKNAATNKKEQKLSDNKRDSQVRSVTGKSVSRLVTLQIHKQGDDMWQLAESYLKQHGHPSATNTQVANLVNHMARQSGYDPSNAYQMGHLPRGTKFRFRYTS